LFSGGLGEASAGKVALHQPPGNGCMHGAALAAEMPRGAARVKRGHHIAVALRGVLRFGHRLLLNRLLIAMGEV
jgi:hypothetical protein